MSASISGTNLVADNFRRPVRSPTGPAGYDEPTAVNSIVPSVPSLLTGGQWALTGPTALGGSVVAPDNSTATESYMTATDATNAIRGIGYPALVAVTGSTTYTLSMYLKRGPINAYIQMNINGGAAASDVYLNLATGSTAIGPPLVAGIINEALSLTPASNFWYRAAYTFTTPPAATTLVFFVGPCLTVSAADNRSYVGTPGQGCYVWGTQFEAGSYATSYIPTTTAPVTRAGHTIAHPGTGDLPLVGAVSGLGNGGASLASGSETWGGIVHLLPGIGAAASGSLQLTWPVAPPGAAGGIWCAADWATLVITQGNPLTVAWTAAAPLNPAGRPHRLAYQYVNLN